MNFSRTNLLVNSYKSRRVNFISKFHPKNYYPLQKKKINNLTSLYIKHSAAQNKRLTRETINISLLSSLHVHLIPKFNTETHDAIATAFDLTKEIFHPLFIGQARGGLSCQFCIFFLTWQVALVICEIPERKCEIYLYKLIMWLQNPERSLVYNKIAHAFTRKNFQINKQYERTPTWRCIR